MAWLIRARAAGFDDDQLLRSDPDLEGVRRRPDFDLLIREMLLAKPPAPSAT